MMGMLGRQPGRQTPAAREGAPDRQELDTSSNAHQSRHGLDRTPIERVVKRTPCLCGCGEFPTRETADFVPGHDAKLKGALVKAHLAGEGFLVRVGDTEVEKTALEVAEERDWEAFLLVAE